MGICVNCGELFVQSARKRSSGCCSRKCANAIYGKASRQRQRSGGFPVVRFRNQREPCAVCLMRVGYGFKTAARLSGLTPRVVYRLKRGFGIPASKRKANRLAREYDSQKWTVGAWRDEQRQFLIGDEGRHWNAREALMLVGLGRCSECLEFKPISEFYVNKALIGGFCNDCKVCDLRKAHEWFLANKEKKRLQTQSWRRRNSDRAKELQRNWFSRSREELSDWYLRQLDGLRDSDLSFLTPGQKRGYLDLRRLVVIARREIRKTQYAT